MNTPAFPKLNRQTLPLLAAVALLAVCGVFCWNPPPSRIADAATFGGEPEARELESGDPPAASPVPGVLGLPPAMLACSGMGRAEVSAQSSRKPVHRPAPDSRTVFSLADLKAQMPQRADGTFVIEVPALHFSANDAAARHVMAGQPVETLAQIASLPVDAGGALRVRFSRLLTHCCSADARPCFIAASLGSPGIMPSSCTTGSWVTLRGRIAYERQPGGYGAVIAVDFITESLPPPNPVLH